MKKKVWMAILAWVLMGSGVLAQELPMFHWENFTTANGLPDNHVYCVLVDGKRTWVGTDNGLGLYENGTWKVFRPADGLAHQAVLSLAVDKHTGDLWIGTMGGLVRFDGAEFKVFRATTHAALQSDRITALASGPHGDLWIGTAAGVAQRVESPATQGSPGQVRVRLACGASG